MTDTLHFLIERYGLIVVFIGCIAEGESVAIIGGFFAHQHVLHTAAVYIAAFMGAFIGDTGFFVLGRRFSDHPRVLAMRERPGFSHAYEMVRKHPDLFVLSNRFIYGMRLVGGVAAGLSGIAVWRFLVFNAASSAAWAALFVTLGYFFGLGAEQILGKALLRHEKLFIGLGIGLVVAVIAAIAAHKLAKRQKIA
ncbi:DedA family protein [Oryzicola mucosus]|uniref:DedA family protein n=1 Tax=Oryzicola mucosus TaxID=2767425 RepID=A0A8J6PKQ8_9HYPH|nr:DedA family protein [Oryzicola mucosus]MBD0416178.1 DedA family protein [Oryzicola mucosus]